MTTDKIKVSLGFSNNLFSIGVCGILEDMASIAVSDLLESGVECTAGRLEELNDNILLVDLNTLYNTLPPPEEVENWPRVVLLDTNCGRENIISAILKKKLRGVIPVNADAGLLLRMLKKVALGEVWIDNKTVKNLIDGVNNMDKGECGVLTDREREIVGLIGEGYRNKEIAKKLHICEPTVKTHLYRIFQKLNIKNRSELVAIALKDSSPMVSL